MSKNGPSAVLIHGAAVYWVKDCRGILVVNENRQESHLLVGVEAVVWTWLTLSYPYPKMVQWLATMLDLPTDETEERLGSILLSWRSAGLVRTEV